MALTLEDTEKILSSWREKINGKDGKLRNSSLSESIAEIAGKQYTLDQLLSEIPSDSIIQMVLKEKNSVTFTKYQSAFFALYHTLQSLKAIDILIENKLFEEGGTIDAIQKNITNILMPSQDIINIFNTLEKGNWTIAQGGALKIYQQKLYDIKGVPKTYEDVANLIMGIPLQHFGLNNAAKQIFKVNLLNHSLNEDHHPFGNYSPEHLFFSVSSLVDKTNKDVSHYFDTINILNSGRGMVQDKMTEIDGLPLAATFHKGLLYALTCDRKYKATICSYSTDGKKIAETDPGKIKGPFSLVGYGNDILLLNRGNVKLIPDSLPIIVQAGNEDSDGSIYEHENKRPKAIEDLVMFEKKEISGYRDEMRDWVLDSIASTDTHIGAVLFNTKTGTYRIPVKSDNGKPAVMEGRNIISSYANTLMNAGNVIGFESSSVTMHMGGAAFPPKIAMLNSGIVVSEGTNIKVLDYNLKEIRKYTLGEGKFSFLNRLFLIPVLSGSGNMFGMYTSFKIEEKECHYMTKPIFLMFSLDDKLNIHFERALDTQVPPLIVATGVAFSKDGYLAIAGNGGRAYADILFPEDSKYKRDIHDGNLEIYRLSRTLGTATQSLMLPDTSQNNKS